MRLFRFEQPRECGIDTVEVVEGQEANGDDAGVEWRLRIGGGLGGLRKEAVNRTAGFHAPFDAAKALAGSLQTFADAGDDLSQSRTCFPAHADGREHVLHLLCLAAHADNLGQLANEFGGSAARNERRVGEKPSEKPVARVGDGTQGSRANPRVCGIALGDGGKGINGTFAD